MIFVRKTFWLYSLLQLSKKTVNDVQGRIYNYKMYIQERFRRYNDIITSNKICIGYNMKV